MSDNNSGGGRPSGHQPDAYRVYVANIDYASTHKDVKEFFSSVGEVAFVEMIKNAEGKSSGTCIVRFVDAIAKEAAEKMNRSEYRGRDLVVKQNYGPPTGTKVSVSNVPFECTIDEIKAVFGKVGEVAFVEIQKDEHNRPNGRCVVRYRESNVAQEAIKELNRVEVRGRNLILKECRETTGNNPQSSQGHQKSFSQTQPRSSAFTMPFNNPINSGSGFEAMAARIQSNFNGLPSGMSGGMPSGMSSGMSGVSSNMGAGMGMQSGFNQNMGSSFGGGMSAESRMAMNNMNTMNTMNTMNPPPMQVWGGNTLPGVNERKRNRSSEFDHGMMSSMQSNASKYGDTYGLSVELLESLGIEGPIVNRIFVANLDYTINEENLNEVFGMAGTVNDIDLVKDETEKSKGYGFIEFDHPLEAVQAVSMFNNQLYMNRKMRVSIVRREKRRKESNTKLPSGLKGIGSGLGPMGAVMKMSGATKSGSSIKTE